MGSGTRLLDGTVLVAGGYNNGGSSNNSALYDVSSGTWSSVLMPMARYYHTATLLLDGKVLICGGYNNNTLDSSALYTSATAPAISSFTPASGCTSNTSVVITGINFTGATAVTFGGSNALSYVVDSATQITAIVGNGTTGTIAVTTANGTGTSIGDFTVNISSAITSPGDQAADAASGSCSAVVTYSEPTVSGWPLPTVTYAFSGATTGSGNGNGSGNSFKTGLTTVTLTAVNECSSSTCSFTVTVFDITPPTIMCTGNISVDNTVGTCGAVVIYQNPTATDNCGTAGNVLLIWDEMNPNTVSLQNSLIAAGNSVTLSTTNGPGYDGTNPPLAGFDAVIHLNGTTYGEGMPAAGQTALVDFVLTQGKTYVSDEWSAYDVDATYALASMSEIIVLQRNNGFTDIDTYTVAPGQESNPLMAGVPATFDLPIGGGNDGGARTYLSNQPLVVMNGNHGVAVAIRNFANGGKAIGFANAGNYDNSTILSDVNIQKLYNNAIGAGILIVQTSGLSSGSTFPVGVTTNVFTSIDPSGNSSVCTQTVTVTDTEKPTISVASTVNATTNTDCTATGVDLGEAIVADNCTVASTVNDAPGAFSIGDTTVTWTVTDASGNIATATQIVTVTDNQNPTITAPPIVYATTNASGFAIDVLIGTPVTADNCSVASVTNDHPSTDYPLGDTTVIWTVTDASGNTMTASQTVTVTTPLIVSASGQTNVSCNGGSDGSATVVLDGGSGSYTYSWSPSGGTSDAETGLAAGTYMVIVTDSNYSWLTITQSFTITEPDLIMVSDSGQTSVLCNGGSDGSATVTTTGGIGNYYYSWSPFGGTADTATGLSAGIYIVTVSDDNGCSVAHSVTITEPNAVTIDSQPSNNTILNGADTAFGISASNANTYVWQISTNGGTAWTDVINGGSSPAYSGAETATLILTGALSNSNGNMYQVVVSNGNCTTILSSAATLTIINVLMANNDDFSATVIYDNAGGNAGNVLQNDMYNGAAISASSVTATLTNDDGLTGAAINAAGDLIIPASAVAGTYIMSYSICETGSINNCTSATITVTISAALGTNDFAITAITLYPNPSIDQVFINIPGACNYTNLKVTVYDMTGKTLMTRFLNNDISSIDISRLASEAYLFKITSDKGQANKLIIKR